MELLGFKYEPRKKGYYVDGHERPATITYRNKFVTRYLQQEQRMYRWVQVTLARSRELNLIKNSGYRYSNVTTGEDMVEYHVDACAKLREEMNESTLYGGRLSIRKQLNCKPLIFFRSQRVHIQTICTHQ